MIIKKEIRTNKARLLFFENGLVEKHYFDASRAASEMKSMTRITIGRWAMIASGAVITKNVPDYALMAGVPAKQTG